MEMSLRQRRHLSTILNQRGDDTDNRDITLDTYNTSNLDYDATATETVVDTNTTYTADGNYGMT